VVEQIQTVTHQFLGREVDYLGFVNRDLNVPKAVMRQQPVSLCFPESPASRCFRQIAARLLGQEETKRPNNVLPFLRHVFGTNNL
jgi:flagellar biosynthesis protein FlhG